MRGADVSLEVESDDGEITYRIDASGWYDPGRTWGPPDQCYPPEGELEIIRCIRLDDDGKDSEEVDYDLTFSEKRRIRIEDDLYDLITSAANDADYGRDVD